MPDGTSFINIPYIFTRFILRIVLKFEDVVNNNSASLLSPVDKADTNVAEVPGHWAAKLPSETNSSKPAYNAPPSPPARPPVGE